MGHCRGGAGTSKVVRPPQIKDHSCMWKGGSYNRQCAAVKATCGIKMRGSGALRTGSMAFEARLWQNLDQLYAK